MGDVRRRASMNASYCSTFPVRGAARLGRGLPSVWSAEKTLTGLNSGISTVFSSMMIFPSRSSMGALVSGSSFISSIFFFSGVGAMMVRPFSPFFT